MGYYAVYIDKNLPTFPYIAVPSKRREILIQKYKTKFWKM